MLKSTKLYQELQKRESKYLEIINKIKEIVAFLNNQEGGILYIGIDDNGQPVENPEIDAMQLKIADRTLHLHSLRYTIRNGD